MANGAFNADLPSKLGVGASGRTPWFRLPKPPAKFFAGRELGPHIHHSSKRSKNRLLLKKETVVCDMVSLIRLRLEYKVG